MQAGARPDAHAVEQSKPRRHVDGSMKPLPLASTHRFDGGVTAREAEGKQIGEDEHAQDQTGYPKNSGRV